MKVKKSSVKQMLQSTRRKLIIQPIENLELEHISMEKLLRVCSFSPLYVVFIGYVFSFRAPIL